jgi:phospholipid/cholesterol/gamma-HCH transport system ATP-binding protein
MNTAVRVNGVRIENAKGVLLDRVTFEVKPGAIAVILGASGCGKSTLLKHMIGLQRPAGGDILIHGESIVTCAPSDHERLMRDIGVLYQSSALFGSMTLLENVMLPLEEHTDLPNELVREIARGKLAAVGLAGFDAYLPARVSGGMKKRAGLARALALDPMLLFLDEPSAGLDPITSAELDRLILSLRDRFGTTMVIVTHELDSIYAVADHVLVLAEGTLVAEGVPRELADRGNEWLRRFFTRDGTRDSSRE